MSLTVSGKKKMRLTLSQPQDQSISNQLISSLQEEKYGCNIFCCDKDETRADVDGGYSSAEQSSFELSQTPSRKSLIWRRVFGERWEETDQTHLHEYFGVNQGRCGWWLLMCSLLLNCPSQITS
jgi:hypothetical protein